MSRNIALALAVAVTGTAGAQTEPGSLDEPAAIPSPPLVVVPDARAELRSPAEHYERGTELMAAGAFEEASLAFGLAIGADPDAVSPRIARGYCRLALGHCRAALADFRGARALDYSLAAPLLGVAQAHEGLGEAVVAARYYRAYAGSKSADVVPALRLDAELAHEHLRPGLWANPARGMTFLQLSLLGAGVGLGVGLLGIAIATAGRGTLLLGLLVFVGGGTLFSWSMMSVAVAATLLTMGLHGRPTPWYKVAPGWGGLGAMFFGALTASVSLVLETAGLVVMLVGVALAWVQVGIALVNWFAQDGKPRGRAGRRPPPACLETPGAPESRLDAWREGLAATGPGLFGRPW